MSYDLKFQGAKSLFSRESMFFLRAFSEEGPGQILYSAYGAIKEIDVTPSTPLKVDNGHLVAFTDGVQYDVVPSGGLKTSFLEVRLWCCRYRDLARSGSRRGTSRHSHHRLFHFYRKEATRIG